MGGGYSGQAISEVLSNTGDIKGFKSPLYWFEPKVIDGFRLNANGGREDPNHPNALSKNTAAKRLLKGALCGSRPKGNSGSEELGASQVLEVVGGSVHKWIQNHEPEVAARGGAETDGLVEVVSCGFFMDNGTPQWISDSPTGTTTIPYPVISKMNASPSEKFVIMAVSHLEETGSFPDVTPVVINWMRNMMCSEIQGSNSACSDLNAGVSLPQQGTEGSRCSLTRPCEGGLHCCSTFCRALETDFAGLPWCPDVCKGRPAWGSGSCFDEGRWHTPRRKGEGCVLDTDCENALGNPPVGCCDKTCQEKKKDYVGIPWCPSICKGRPEWVGGTCDRDGRLHWPRKMGESCVFDTDCEGWNGSFPRGCCSSSCKEKKKDYVQSWWCPEVCKSGFFSPPGSC